MNHKEYIIPIGEEVQDYDEMFIGVIRRQPELVRCKDCKYYLEDSYGEDEWVMCRRTNLYTDGDKYCAWAERKEE